MDAALGFVEAAPAAGAGVLARLDLGRAGYAANRRIAARDQRMLGQVAAGGVGRNVGARPTPQRGDLFAPATCFEHLQSRAAPKLGTPSGGGTSVQGRSPPTQA